MRFYLVAALLGFTLLGCGTENSPSTPEEGSDLEYAGTPSQADSIRSVRQEGGEPGIPGTDIPSQMFVLADGSCYGYPGYMIRVSRNGVGEAVAAYSGRGRELCTAPQSQAVFATDTDGDPETFFGLVGDLLLLEVTVDDEHLIRVVDLESGFVVHETVFEEPVEVADGGLLYGEPAIVFETPAALSQVAIDCADSDSWFEDSLAVGVSIRTRYDLTSRTAEQTDDVTCIPLL